MKCSLVIMVYNDIKTLTLTFESLKIQTEKDFEVIIADDGSNSDFVSKLQKLISEANFKVKHIWHEDNGWQKEIVMNKAIVASESDYIIFIDGDCIPHKRGYRFINPQVNRFRENAQLRVATHFMGRIDRKDKSG